MKTIYSTTCPSFHDTAAISKAKWLQAETLGSSPGRFDRSVLYSQPETTNHDTKAIVLGKILQGHCDAGGIAIDIEAVTNFDGTEVELSWDAPAGSYGSSAGYNVYRNGVLLARVPFGTNTYTDTTVESGKTYSYSVIFHPS